MLAHVSLRRTRHRVRSARHNVRDAAPIFGARARRDACSRAPRRRRAGGAGSRNDVRHTLPRNAHERCTTRPPRHQIRRTVARSAETGAAGPNEEHDMAASDLSPTDTIVLIHGLWMTSRCWEHWVTRYTDRGYRVIASSWPGMEGDIEQLRRDPSAIARLGVEEVVAHYATLIRGLERPPILMGHSYGGAFVQLLLDRGLGAA